MRALLHDLSYRRPFAWAVLWPVLWLGVAAFRITGRTPWLSYWAMRRLYCVTRGRSNEWLARTLGTPVAVVTAPADGPAGKHDAGAAMRRWTRYDAMGSPC